jgi:signal peptide peptidase SppA
MKLIDIVNGPWAIAPEMLGEIQSIYRAHVRGPKIDIPAVEARIGRPLKNEAKSYQVIDGVAVLELSGPIARRMNLFMQISGGTSSELFRRDFLQALEDPTVSAVVMAINSPGGTVDGTQELADTIYAQRGKKPVVALAEGTMASAAYWIGAAADAIYMSESTAMVGSIGVVASHVDMSRAEEMAGQKTTEITAGRYKRIASEYEPLTSEGRAEIQAKVDALYAVFVDSVATYRGVSVEDVLTKMADGKLFVGKEAMEAGLVDGVSNLDALIAQLTQKAGAGVARAEKKGTKIMTLDMLRADHPDLVEALVAEATEGMISAETLQDQLAAARAEAITAERERIAAIEALAIPGHDALIAQLKAEGASADEAALKIIGAEKQVRQSALAAIEQSGSVAVPHAEAQGGSGVDPSAPLEDRARAEFDRDADLRAEFGGRFEPYLAYRKAEDSKRARVLGKQ